MKRHKKQTLFTFIGILFVISCVKMAADYRYVTKREAEYKKQSGESNNTPEHEFFCDGINDYVDTGFNPSTAGCNGDTIKYTWQILKRNK